VFRIVAEKPKRVRKKKVEEPESPAGQVPPNAEPITGL